MRTFATHSQKFSTRFPRIRDAFAKVLVGQRASKTRRRRTVMHTRTPPRAAVAAPGEHSRVTVSRADLTGSRRIRESSRMIVLAAFAQRVCADSHGFAADSRRICPFTLTFHTPSQGFATDITQFARLVGDAEVVIDGDAPDHQTF
eukprot:5911800-Prymnesium_polylepis.1